jgi:flagellar hook-associated protein 2
MTSTGSISLSGLLGGTAGQIDTTALISSLMTAAAVPQNQLKDQLSTVASVMSAYQAVNTRVTAMQTAAQALTDVTAWSATAATSSSNSVLATSDGTAALGNTTFDVTRLAASQVSTITPDSSGNVVSDPTAGITITGADGTAHPIPLTSGSAADVAAAINTAAVGVRASVVSTDQGNVLQLTSTKSGVANGFSLSGTATPMQNLVTPQDAMISVGNLSAGGYTVTSSSNTFSNFIPGVTFSANALANAVTVSVGSDDQSISDKVQALVTAANAVTTQISSSTAAGGTLQGENDVRSTALSLMSAVSGGTLTGQSLKKYGIDIDKNGIMSFDATAFSAAFAADPAGTQSAISGSFATKLDSAATAAAAPVTGILTQSIAREASQSTQLNTEIANWTTKLATTQTNMQVKYAAMETALAKLQSQQTYLTSMFNSLNGNSSSNSSSSN